MRLRELLNAVSSFFSFLLLLPSLFLSLSVCCACYDDRVLYELLCSPREKVVKFLQSNPVQILLCVIVLLDAVIVIAQILLDLNSVKRQCYSFLSTTQVAFS